MAVTLDFSDARESCSRRRSSPVGGLLSLVTRELFRFEELRRGRDPRYVLTIGASAKCHIVLDDPFVSSVHAAVTWEDGALRIVDLRSRNGVFQVVRRRGQKIQRAALALGQRFVLGRTTLVCVTEDGHAPLTAFEVAELASLSHDILADMPARSPRTASCRRGPTPTHPPPACVHRARALAPLMAEAGRA